MNEPQDDTNITDRATEWLEVLKAGGAQERAAFSEWLRKSPRHVGEFLMVSAVMREFDRVDSEHAMDVPRMFEEGGANVVPLADAPQPVVHRAPRHWLGLGIAATITACAIGIGWTLVARPDWQRYETEAGEQRIIDLKDGSRVHLNVDSRVDVHFSATGRELRLTAGEALFTVARDAQRPFRVHSGNASIQALGTQFNVYRRARGTTVSVLEGAVQVKAGIDTDATRLNAGQQVNVALGGKIEPLPLIDAIHVSAWRQHRLVFLEDRLEDVAAEFNRYNPTPRIQVEGAGARSRKLTGVFDANDPASLVQFLSDVRELEIVHSEDGVTIRAR